MGGNSRRSAARGFHFECTVRPFSACIFRFPCSDNMCCVLLQQRLISLADLRHASMGACLQLLNQEHCTTILHASKCSVRNVQMQGLHACVRWIESETDRSCRDGAAERHDMHKAVVPQHRTHSKDSPAGPPIPSFASRGR